MDRTDSQPGGDFHQRTNSLGVDMGNATPSERPGRRRSSAYKSTSDGTGGTSGTGGTATVSSRRASFFIGDAEGNKQPVKIVGPDEVEITPDEIVVPPDGGYGYVIVFAAFMSNVIVDGIVFSFGSIKDPILDASKAAGVELDQATLAWVGSLLTGFYLLTGPFVSAVANKWGFRVVAVLGSVIASAAFIISFLLNQEKPNIGYLVIFYGVMGGIGFSCIYVPAVIAVGFYFERKRALATGIAICGSGIGNFIFPPLINVLVKEFKWNGAICALGCIVLLCGVLGLLYKPLKAKKARRMSVMTPEDTPQGTPLLMRIKRAREMMSKWDSVNSFTSNRESYVDIQQAAVAQDPKARSEAIYTRARKTSTSSLKGSAPVAIPVGMQRKRLSVPSIHSGSVGEPPSPVVSPSTGGGGAVLLNPPKPPTSNKAKSFVGLPDLHEIEEEHGSEEAGSRENSVVPDNPLQKPIRKESMENGGPNNNNKESSALLSHRNSSVTTCRIGNSTLTVDEMTNSKIIRVASKVTLNKPLYRDDIFYSGSILRIPDYANNNPMTSQEWTAVVTSPPEGPGGDGDVTDSPKKRRCCKGCGVVNRMLDFSLLLSPTFVVFCISGMFSMVGLFVPFVFLMDQAKYKLKTTDNETDALLMLISVIGAANTVGRILSGWIADRPWVNALILNNGAVTVMGACCLAVPFMTAYPHFVGFSGCFGISMACFASLRSILVVELLGLAKLTNAFGLLLLFQGVASMVATPIAGIIVQYSGGETSENGDGTKSQDFSLAFYFAGAALIVSALMCYPLNRLNRWEKRRNGEIVDEPKK